MPEDEYTLEERRSGKPTVTHLYKRDKQTGPPIVGEWLEDFDLTIDEKPEPPTATAPGRIIASRHLRP